MNYTSQAIETAYQKIKYHYSNNGKGFIHHLIGAFLPIQEHEYYLITDKKCVITDKLGFCTKTYDEMTEGLFLLQTRMIIGDEERSNNAKIEIENQYPIFRFMIKIPPVSNKSNKPRVKIVNFNKETNKFEFHIPKGHENDPFYQQSVKFIEIFKSIFSQSRE